MTATPLNVFECDLSDVSLIEASAGTGKTWNLCALYLRLLLQRRLAVHQILVVTFTKTATAELRQKIRERIAETLSRLNGAAAGADAPFVDALLVTLRENPECDEEELKLRLGQALQSFDEAAIFTIHGFCEQALRDTPLAAGLPLSMEIITDESALARSVAADFWRREVASGELLAGLAGYLVEEEDTPEKFARLLLRRTAKPLAQLRWPAEPVTEGAEVIVAQQRAFDAARLCWQRDREAIVACMIAALPRLDGRTHTLKNVTTSAASWDRYLAGTDALDAPRGLEKLDQFTTRGLKPKVRQAPPAHDFFVLAQSLLDQRKSAEEALRSGRARLLQKLLERGPVELRMAKQAQRVMSFDDLLYNLFERLTNPQYPWLAQALRARYPAALIDEFQDTDPLQFSIFKCIYAGTGLALFLIGDPKQAIYSFRNADLRVYLHARGEATRRYTLAENQRCSEALLQALNRLFGSHEQAFMVEGLDYIPLVYGRKPRLEFVDSTQARAPLQMWSLPHGAGGLLAKTEARLTAARACAAEIARLLAAGQQGAITLAGSALMARHIAVLVRTHNEGRQMREALEAVAVGSIEMSPAGIFSSTEAQEIERILAAILEPMRAPRLRAAYSTVLLGGDAARLEALAADDEEIFRRMNDLAQYRDEWLQSGVGVMLRRFINDKKIAARLLALPFGERRLTNLLHLMELLHQAGTHDATPEVLLLWLQEKLAHAEPQEEAELRLESDRNLVQILTIHRAKGLEYPIVFCPFLWDGYPGPGDKGNYAHEYHDADGGLVMDFRAETGAAEAEQMALDRFAERVRLIYVALTRAIHRCYLVVGNYTSRNSVKEGARGSLHWLVAGAGQNAVDWRKREPDLAKLNSAWSAFAQAGAPYVGYTALPPTPPVPLPGLRRDPASIEILAPPALIPPGWRLGSYSQLIHGASGERAAEDHDLRWQTGITGDTSVPDSIALDDIVRFPRGLTAGHCIHAVFEKADFTRPDAWDGVIERALRAHPQTPRKGSLAEHLPSMLATMLRDVVHTPLPGGVRLAGVPGARRLNELKFSFPVSHLTQQALKVTLAHHDVAMPALQFAELRGYLNGAIDLVVEAQGRYWIIDWKSNYLGATAESYAAAHLPGAMDRHFYHLQYLLYTVALHRYLQVRLPGYAYDRHVGGALYLFVRGVRPGWIDRDAQPCGVYSNRPAEALITALSALMDAARDVA